MARRILTLFCSVLLMAGMTAWAQSPVTAQQDEQLSFIGMKLDEVYRRFGPPQAVYAARGEENWQDDVVFVYSDRELYIYRDRVWQIKTMSIYGMRVGDAKGVALLVLGQNPRSEGDYVVASLPGGAWLLSLRVNFSADKIASIYVYRPDY